MVKVGAVLPRLDHLADEDRGDLVVLGAVVLVPLHNEQTVMGQSPFGITVYVLLQPGVTHRNW